MIHITSYKNPFGKAVTFLFNKEDGFLYRDSEGKKQIMGRPENFVFPHVPRPQDMETAPARALTVFCMDWLYNQKEKLV